MDAMSEMRPALPFTLRSSKTRQAVLFLGGLAFTVGGVLMIRDGLWKGWFCAIFFGLCTLIFLAQLCTNASRLTVTADGMEIRALFRTTKIKWTDVSEFGISVMPFSKMASRRRVGFNYVTDYPLAAKGRAAARVLSGFEGMLPDTYGMSVEGLLEMLRTIHREQVQGKEGVRIDG